MIHLQVLGRHDGSTGVDYTVNAATGFPLVTGPVDHAGPINHVLPAWDVCCGLYAALAVVAAVRRRDQSGVGAQISLALEDVALATAGNLGLLTEPQVNGTERERLGNAIYGQYGQDFTSRDGVAFMVVTLTKRHFQDLVEVCGCRCSRFRARRLAGRGLRRRGSALPIPRGAQRTVRDVVRRPLGRRDHPGAVGDQRVVRALPELSRETAADERVTANPLFSRLHQDGLGDYLAPGLPTVFDGSHFAGEPAPRLGGDTADVLTAASGVERRRHHAA